MCLEVKFNVDWEEKFTTTIPEANFLPFGNYVLFMKAISDDGWTSPPQVELYAHWTRNLHENVHLNGCRDYVGSFVGGVLTLENRNRTDIVRRLSGKGSIILSFVSASDLDEMILQVKQLQVETEKLRTENDILKELVDRPNAAGASYAYEELQRALQ